MVQGNPARASASLIGLAHCRIARPAAFGGGVEIVEADPAMRRFPVRLDETLGVCLKAGPPHTVISDGATLTYPADALCIRQPGCVWSSDVTGAGFVAIDIAPRLAPAGLAPAPMRFLDQTQVPHFRTIARRLQRDDDPLDQQEALAELVNALFACGALEADELHESVEPQRTVRRAREFLAERIDNGPTLDELAGAVRANKFVLIRNFRHALGTTPHRYLLGLRIDRARSLLAQRIPLMDVAVEVGFADQAHLTRHFKRIVGITPGEYARSMRGRVATGVTA